MAFVIGFFYHPIKYLFQVLPHISICYWVIFCFSLLGLILKLNSIRIMLLFGIVLKFGFIVLCDFS